MKELGRVEGYAEVYAEGYAEGRTEERLSAIRTLMASMSWSAEQAMEALRIPEADWSKHADLLLKQ